MSERISLPLSARITRPPPASPRIAPPQFSPANPNTIPLRPSPCFPPNPPPFSAANPNTIPLRPRLASQTPESSPVPLSLTSNAFPQQLGAGIIANTNLNQPPRYEDGEVRRYGAGESYRPFNRDRSPRGIRSPVRDRVRTPPPPASDSYVPGRSPR